MTAANSLLLIAGGEAVMRQTFREHGRAYWSAEFSLILEKHGWLDFETAEPDVLESVSNLEGYAMVVVAWLPEDAWRQEYVESLGAYAGIVLLEGPFPPEIEQMLQIERGGAPVIGARGSLCFASGARAFIDGRFGTSFPIGHRSGPDPSITLAASGDPQPLELGPRESVTRRPGLGRDAYSDLAVEPFEENVGRAAVSITLAYRARFARNERFFDEPVEDALALLACVRCLAALSIAGPLRDAFRRLVLDAAGSNRPPVVLSDKRTALARAIWGVALVEASRALNDTTFAERAKEVVRDTRAEWHWRKPRDAVLSRWRALLALQLSELAGAGEESTAIASIGAFVPLAGERPTPMLASLDAALSARIGLDRPETLATSACWVQAIAAGLKGSSGATLGRELDGFTVPELILLMGALRQSEHLSAARRLWRVLLEALYDTRQGLLMSASVVDGKIAPTMGFATSPLVALGYLDAAGPIEIVDAPTRALERYTTAQVDAWAAAPYSFQPYMGVDDASFVTLATGTGQLPAIWRRGNVIATAFQLLAQLVHMHTVEPLAEPFLAFRSGDTIALEYLLMHMLGAALAEHSPCSVQVGPWPWGVHYGLTIRHDVDRVLNEQQFTRLLGFERSHSLAVSWFWLSDRLEPDQLATLDREPRHEVALHAARIDQKSRELELVGRAVSTPIVGEAIHGSGDGWLGHLSVRAALDAGLLYTELAPPVADCPYARYPWVDSTGRVGAERIVGVSYNISIEGKLGVRPGSEGGPGLYRQLLNHPDLNFDRLENWVSSLPAGKRVDWTCEQLARWWQSTHVAGSLSVRHLPEAEAGVKRFEVLAQQPVEDVELRVPSPPGSVLDVSVDGHEAEWTQLSEPEYSGLRIRASLESGVPRVVVVRRTPGTPDAAGEPAAAMRATPEP